MKIDYNTLMFLAEAIEKIFCNLNSTYNILTVGVVPLLAYSTTVCEAPSLIRHNDKIL